MLRTISALAVSLIAHVVVIVNLNMPAVSADSHNIINIRIQEQPAIAEMPVELMEPAEIAEAFPVIDSKPADREIENPFHETPDIETISQPIENADSDDERDEAEITDEIAADNGPGETVSGNGDPGDIGGESDIDDGMSNGIENGFESEGNGQGNAGNGNESDTPALDLDAIRADYSRRVLNAISSHKKYPQTARRLGQEGNVGIRFHVALDGSVSMISIESSSGFTSLDNAARDAVNSASPVPPIPEELDVETMILSLAIIFDLD